MLLRPAINYPTRYEIIKNIFVLGIFLELTKVSVTLPTASQVPRSTVIQVIAHRANVRNVYLLAL